MPSLSILKLGMLLEVAQILKPGELEVIVSRLRLELQKNMSLLLLLLYLDSGKVPCYPGLLVARRGKTLHLLQWR